MRWSRFLPGLVLCAAVFVAGGLVQALAGPRQGEPVMAQPGMRGADVLRVQSLLAGQGFYAGAVDGVFGPLTGRAVADFQTLSGLPPSGVVDQHTLRALERAQAQPGRFGRSLVMQATAYSRFDPGCGSYTARGNLLRKGLVAVDPAVIPLGTRLYISGYGFAVADDIGGGIKGHVIDLAFDTHQEALGFGWQQVTVYIMN